MRRTIGFAALFAGAALGSALLLPSAVAGENQSVSAGVLAGLAFPSLTGTSTRFGWGLQGDYNLTKELAAGLYFLTSSQDTGIPAVGSQPAVTSNNRISLYGVQGRYIFPQVPGLGAGARVGVGHASTDVNGQGSVSNTGFSIGPFVNYDYRFAPQFSVGADASLLFVTTSPGYNVVNLLATLKFWL